MKQLSIGKLRGLQRCANQSGTFTVLALDHRQNLRKSLNPHDPYGVSSEDLTNFKLEVLSSIGGDATAILLDPEYSAAQAIAKKALPKDVGLVVALEETGYIGTAHARRSQLLSEWYPAKAKRMGADIAKLLVYYHPDSSTAKEIENLVLNVAEECDRNDMCLMLEPLSYSLDKDNKVLSSQEKNML